MSKGFLYDQDIEKWIRKYNIKHKDCFYCGYCGENCSAKRNYCIYFKHNVDENALACTQVIAEKHWDCLKEPTDQQTLFQYI